MDSPTTDDLAQELSAESRRLERKISDLVSLRKLVAEKESAAGLRREGANGRPPGEVGSPNSEKASIHELPEQTWQVPQKLFGPTEAPSSKQNSELAPRNGGPATSAQSAGAVSHSRSRQAGSGRQRCLEGA